MNGNSGASMLDFVKRLALGIILFFIIFAMLFLKPATEDDYKNNKNEKNENNNTNTACENLFNKV